MTEIFRTNSLAQAVALQTALQAAGIDAALQGEHSLGITGNGVAVVVLDDRAVNRARLVLRKMDTLADSVPTLHKPLEDIGREYRRRWVNHLWVTLSTAVYVVAVAAVAGISLPVRAALLIGGAVVAGVLDTRIWRCPNCGRSFGRSLWQARCPNCRISFTSHSEAAA